MYANTAKVFVFQPDTVIFPPGPGFVQKIFLKCLKNVLKVLTHSGPVHMNPLNISGILPMRDKRKKFVQLAEARVNRAIKDIRLVGNLSNRAAYAYTEEDAKKIFRVLLKEIETARARFGDGAGGGDNEFRLEG